MQIDVSFIQDVNVLRSIYQEANEIGNIDLVRQLNDLGMKPEVPPLSKPAIISNFMDIATKSDGILNFLQNLRTDHRLFTK